MNFIGLRSSPHPNGVSWVGNALLAMGIPVGPGKSLSTSWAVANGGLALRPRRVFVENYSQILNITSEQIFESQSFCSFDHTWPQKRMKMEKLILAWRNPFDALYSQYKRHSFDDGRFGLKFSSFSEFLESEEPNTGLRPANLWASYFEAWVLADHDPLILEFQEFKAQPDMALRRLAKYLGISIEEENLKKLSIEADRLPPSKTFARPLNSEKHREGKVFNDLPDELRLEVIHRTQPIVSLMQEMRQGTNLNSFSNLEVSFDQFFSDLLVLERSFQFRADARLLPLRNYPLIRQMKSRGVTLGVPESTAGHDPRPLPRLTFEKPPPIAKNVFSAKRVCLIPISRVLPSEGGGFLGWARTLSKFSRLARIFFVMERVWWRVRHQREFHL